MFFTLEKIISLILVYKYAIIFPIAIIEGPIVTLVAGSLAATGHLNLELTFVVVVVADVVGDVLHYVIGRYGGLYFIQRWRGFFTIDQKKLEMLEHTFSHHGRKVLLLGKLQSLGSVVLLAAGMAKYNFGLFLWYNTLATVCKSGVLLMIGYLFYQQLATSNSIIVKTGIFLSILLVIFVIWYLHKRPLSV